MNFVRCSRGHFYDSDRHSFCPQCGKPEPAKAAGDEENRTAQLGGSGNTSASDEEYKTVQLNLGGNGGAGNASASDDEYKTVQLNLGGNGTAGNASASDDEYKTVQLNLGGNGTAGNTSSDDEYKTVQLNLGGNGTAGNASSDDEYKTVQLNLGGNGAAGNTSSSDDEYKTVQLNLGGNGSSENSGSGNILSESSPKKESSLGASIQNLQSEYDAYTLEKDAEILIAAGKKDAADQIAEKINAVKQSEQDSISKSEQDAVNADVKPSATEQAITSGEKEPNQALTTGNKESDQDLAIDEKENNQVVESVEKESDQPSLDDEYDDEPYGTLPEYEVTIPPLVGWVVQLSDGKELSTTLRDGFCGLVTLGAYFAINCGKEKAADAICINYNKETREYVIFSDGYLLKINGHIIEGSYRLVSGDRITAGENEFIFVAFPR